jgi:hypothetical protein
VTKADAEAARDNNQFAPWKRAHASSLTSQDFSPDEPADPYAPKAMQAKQPADANSQDMSNLSHVPAAPQSGFVSGKNTALPGANRTVDHLRRQSHRHRFLLADMETKHFRVLQRMVWRRRGPNHMLSRLATSLSLVVRHCRKRSGTRIAASLPLPLPQSIPNDSHRHRVRLHTPFKLIHKSELLET